MRRLERFQTSDGKEHASERFARNYCDEQMGKILVDHARKLCQIDKFQDVLKYLEENISDLAQAERWRREMLEPLDCEEA